MNNKDGHGAGLGSAGGAGAGAGGASATAPSTTQQTQQTPRPQPIAHQVAHMMMPTEQTPPNRILFVENLPPEANQLMLQVLFQQYQGFQEARLVPGKPGIAFVEYQDLYQAGTAMTTLQNFKITPTHLMKISFARQ